MGPAICPLRLSNHDKVRITSSSGITRISFSGDPDLDDFRRATDEIAACHPQARRLWDVRGISYRLTLEELESISAYGKYKLKLPCRVAVLVTEDLAYGIGRQFEAVRTIKGHTVVRVFRDEAEAIAWLTRE